MLDDKALMKYARDRNLSSKQVDVLREILLNPHETSDQLAQRLGCSPSTFNVHIANIVGKCGLKNRRDLINNLKGMMLTEQAPELTETFTVLFADDDPVFRDKVAALIRRFAGEKAQVILFDNGLELIMHLSQARPGSTEYLFPDIILLDMVMPTMDGSTALAKIKSESRWNDIPVVVFSSSAEKDSINSSYSNGANSYIVKPRQDAELEKVIKLILEYWGRIGSSPRRDSI